MARIASFFLGTILAVGAWASVIDTQVSYNAPELLRSDFYSTSVFQDYSIPQGSPRAEFDPENVPLSEKSQTISERIRQEARTYGVKESLALKIAWCESGFQNVCNRQSCRFGMGVFQFIQSTWTSSCKGDVMNVEDNITCAVKLLAEGGSHHWGTPETNWGSYQCWKGEESTQP